MKSIFISLKQWGFFERGRKNIQGKTLHDLFLTQFIKIFPIVSVSYVHNTKKSVDEKSGGEENLWNNSLQANESRKKNFWRRGERACERKFYYIYFFFGFYGGRQATEQKLPFDEALKVKQIEKHFFALSSLGSLVLWVRMNLTKSSKRSCTFEKSLLHEGISASQAGVTNVLRNCAKFAHTRVVFRIKLR